MGEKNMRWEEKFFLKLLHSLSIRLLFANEGNVSWGNAKLFAKAFKLGMQRLQIL